MYDVADTPEENDETWLTIVLLGLLPMLPKLRNSDVRVLMAVARLTHSQGNHGFCVIHQSSLADLAGVTRSTIYAAATRLEEAGLLEVFTNKGGAIGSMPNTYMIQVDEFYRSIFNDEHLTALLFPDGLPEDLKDDSPLQ